MATIIASDDTPSMEDQFGEPKATPAAGWRQNGGPDPFGGRHTIGRAPIPADAVAWHSMESAPKDGTRMLLVWKPVGGLSEHVELGKWKRRWCNTYGNPFDGDPDAWAPLAPFTHPERAGDTEPGDLVRWLLQQEGAAKQNAIECEQAGTNLKARVWTDRATKFWAIASELSSLRAERDAAQSQHKKANERFSELSRLFQEHGVRDGNRITAAEASLAAEKQRNAELEREREQWRAGVEHIALKFFAAQADVGEAREKAHYATGTADLAMKHRDASEQRVAALEGALTTIARQKLSTELEGEDADNADYEAGYDGVVGMARTALRPAEGEPTC